MTYSEVSDQIEQAIEPLRSRIAALESQVKLVPTPSCPFCASRNLDVSQHERITCRECYRQHRKES